MANEIYLRTHGALANLVSGRAATRMLRDALRSAGTDPERVSAAEMNDLLTTSVLDDLEAILPRDGIKRAFSPLIGDLRERADRDRRGRTDACDGASNDASNDASGAAPNGAATGEAFAETAAARAPTAAEGGTPDLEVDTIVPSERASAASQRQEDPATDPAPDPPEPAGAAPTAPNGAPNGPTPAASTIPIAPTAARPAPTPEAALQEAVMRFAHLDHVTFVAAVRRGGRVVYSRGGGVDADALARRAASCLALIRRAGSLTTFTLQTGDAVLVLAPMGDDLVVVVGTPNLNLGAVFTARSALQEEL